MARLFSFILACAATLLLVGCLATTSEVDPKRVQAYLSDKPAGTHKLFSKVVEEGERNRVLHLLRAGLAAMEMGHRTVAAQAFDEALLTIETVYGGDDKAAKARSTFTAEDRKTFRGEPYERAMAFYYRGILYLMDGDYENARASFKSGILQDTLAEQEEYRQDFALLEFLEGWSSQCNGNTDMAAEAYVMAKQHSPGSTLPDAADNLLVLADVGYAPVKYADGKHKELLKIKKNDTSFAPDREFRLNGADRSLANEESVLRQAQTRGGREFDAILEGKAQFKEEMKETAEAAGTVAQAGLGLGMAGLASGNEDLARVGGGMAAIGGLVSLFASATAEATKPQADTRNWDNLPESVLYGAYRVDLNAGAPDVQGEPGTRLSQGGDARCRVAWTRHPATAL